MEDSDNSLSRRELLKNAAILGSGAAFMPYNILNSRNRSKSGPIVAENNKPGTREWQLQYTGFATPVTMASYPLNRYLRSRAIEGYVSKTSLLPGESIDFKVSTEPEADFVIDIYRMGYYGGMGGRHMVRLGSFKGRTQSVPMMSVERLRECDWETATTFTIPKDWPSGVYLGKLSRDEKFGKQSYVIFVVKEQRSSDVLCQVSDLTWQSYNKWPANDSLYDDGTPSVWYTGTDVRVSFDRPYAKFPQILDAPLSAGSGEFLLWEHPLVFWLEKNGYDVTYCSNLDLHLNPQVLKSSKVFLSVGHDEYWSRKMYEEAVKARDEGLSFAFLCGNSLHIEVEFFDSSVTGEPCRVFKRNKYFEDNQELMGTSSYGVGYGDWIVKNSQHWIYEDTDLDDNDGIPGIIGWEYHGPPFGNIDNIEIIAESSLSPVSPDAESGKHSAIVYPCAKGNWVFNAGTIWWSEGLSHPPGHVPAGSAGMEEFLRPGEYPAGHNPAGRTFGVNPVVQKITANVIDRMIEDSPL